MKNIKKHKLPYFERIVAIASGKKPKIGYRTGKIVSQLLIKMLQGFEVIGKNKIEQTASSKFMVMFSLGKWISITLATAGFVAITSQTSPSVSAAKPIDTEAKKILLQTHNQYREEVGVYPLEWSQELAASAQNWAEHLAEMKTMEHSESNGEYGENIWSGTKGYFSWEDMVNAWGKEKQYFIPNRAIPNACEDNWQKCAHYTQLIWQDTKKVGCGLASNDQREFLVCQYNPPGNVRGEQPY
jgi:uncharacterized protein YkwD